MTLVGATVLSSVFGGLKETLSHCTELSLSPTFKLLCPPATRMQQIICSSTVVITVCLLYFQPEWPSPPAPTSFLPLLLAPPPPPSPSHPQPSISHSTNPTQALLPQQPRPNGICKPWLFDQQKIHSIQRETKKKQQIPQNTGVSQIKIKMPQKKMISVSLLQLTTQRKP